MASNDSTWHIVTVQVAISLVFVGVAFVASGCEQGKVAGGRADGAQIYQSICAACHGAKGKPDASNVARLGVKDLTSNELRGRITPALVEQQVRRGSQNKLMPSFEGAITDEQIRAVAVFVASSEFLDQR